MAGNLLLRMPLLGDTLRKNMQARFCKLLCLLASSGVPLLQGIDVLTGELEHRLRSLGGMLEPILILLVGLLVAVILISMYLPIFRLGGIMG